MLIEPETSAQDDKKRFRVARIKQARHLANVAAKRIRNRVRFTRETLQKEAEDDVYRQLVARQMAMIESAADTVEATYREEVGRAYEEADFVAKEHETRRIIKSEEAKRFEKRTAKRFEEAKTRFDDERADAVKDEIYRRVAKQSALEKEMERTKSIISRPPPPKSEVEKVAAELEETKRRPFRVLESNVYQSTRYHLGIDDGDFVKDVEEPTKQTAKPAVNRIKVTSLSHHDCDDDDKPHQKAPQPMRKEPTQMILPKVEKPATLEAAKSVAKALDADAEKEAALKKRREELEEKARVRGEAALKHERDSRHYEKLLSDLTTLQQVWRKNELASQPHVIAGRVYVGPDHIEAEKRAQQHRLEAAFNPIVKAATANLPPISENEQLNLSPTPKSPPKSEQSEEESAVGTCSTSSLSSFCWKEASVTSEEQMLTGEKSVTTCSDYVAQSSPSSTNEETETTTMSSELPPLEPQPLSPVRAAEIQPFFRPLSGLTATTTTTNGSSMIETGPLPLQPPSFAGGSSSDSSSLSAGTLTSSTLVPEERKAAAPIVSLSSYDWLMEHNRLLMAKIESHRHQIENQRVALARRLEQLNVRVASPLRVSTKIHELQQSMSTGGSFSAPSSLTRPNVKANEGDESVIAFSPSHSSSFLSDFTPRRLPPFLNHSGSGSSTESSVLSTGLLSNSGSSLPSTPSQNPLQIKPVLSTLPEHENEMSLLIEKSSSSNSSNSVVAAAQKSSSSATSNSNNETSSLGSLMQDYVASTRQSGGSGAGGGDSQSSKQTAPVLPALSSTPRRESESPKTGGETSKTSSQSPPVAFRSLLLEPDQDEDEDVDDFDLPPPPLVGDESFLNLSPQ